MTLTLNLKTLDADNLIALANVLLDVNPRNLTTNEHIVARNQIQSVILEIEKRRGFTNSRLRNRLDSWNI